MKIANLMFGAHRGGVEQAVVDYCLALKSVGHEVTAILRENAAVLPQVVAAGLDYHTLRLPHRLNPFASGQLSELLQGYDLLILHGNRAGELTRNIPGLPPVIAVAHSRFFDAHPHFNAIIALTDARAEQLRTKARCPVYVVPNMIALPPEEAQPAFRRPPVIGTMGRFAPIKGLDLLVNALALLDARGIAVSAVIGGEGAELIKIKKLAETLGVASRITWHGWVSDKTAFFRDMDIYCMSSRSESFPITLLEAMAHGMPVSSTDCGGPGAMLTPGTGILTEISAEGIADGLMRLVADPAAAAQMGRNARARVEQYYAFPIVARRLDQVARDVTQRRPVLNIMLGRGRGGLEQAAVDYAAALRLGGIDTITLTAPSAAILPALEAQQFPLATLNHRGWWDPLATRRLRRFADRYHARAVICHGNRALAIARRALPDTPVIAVAHNFRLARFPGADAAFCTTHHVMQQLMDMGIAREKLFFMPNSAPFLGAEHNARVAAMAAASRSEANEGGAVAMGDLPPTSRSDQPKIIGTLGRFIPRKGFADWIEALSILKARGIAFHAVLGGDGEERPYLERLMRKHDLADHLSFNGWVEDKEAFYTGLDLFVLPSHFEPFGLVLLEAIAYGVPIVSTEVEGPREIIQQGESGLLAAPRNPEALADAMQQMLADPARARLMAQAALAHARREYSPAAMAARLRDTLEKIAPLPAGTTSLYKDAA